MNRHMYNFCSRCGGLIESGFESDMLCKECMWKLEFKQMNSINVRQTLNRARIFYLRVIGKPIDKELKEQDRVKRIFNLFAGI